MVPNWDRNGPQVKLPKISTTGFFPRESANEIHLALSCVSREKAGASRPRPGPSENEPISPENRPLRSVAREGPPEAATFAPFGGGAGGGKSRSARSSCVRNFFPFEACTKAPSHSSREIRPLPFRSIRENRPRAWE